jgi:hypothetical protein
MKFLLLIFIGLDPLYCFSQPSSTLDSYKKPSVEMSANNECKKDLEKLSAKVKCLKCCIGEMNESECNEYNNYKYCSFKKKCGCD